MRAQYYLIYYHGYYSHLKIVSLNECYWSGCKFIKYIRIENAFKWVLLKYRASVPCSVRTKFIRRELIHTAAVATNQTHATWIARRHVWQTHSWSLNALVSYFVVASRNVKIGDGADQKDFLGNCYAENRRYMASEGKKIQRKETLNRHIPYYNVDSAAWHFLSDRSTFEVP